MLAMLNASKAIDRLNRRIGQSVIWLILVAVLVSTFNALVRKFFNLSSNAFLELQWYLFSGVFLLSGAYTLARNGHVRIDVVSGRFGPRGQAWIDVFGLIFFLAPVCVLVLITSWPVFVTSWESGEVSNNAGGLLLWPARLLVPVGFGLLLLQGASELIKRIAVLKGIEDESLVVKEEQSAEAALAEEIRRMQNNQGAS
ncbi:MAG: TRAP transporter small permease subunit [Burkholderiales bacterium]|nr:TRAP transporter small permease subunit [Burkholderiales bacterium]